MTSTRTATKVRESRAVRLGRAVHLNVLLLANRNLSQLEEICKPHGLTHAQYVVLWTLCTAEDSEAGIPVGEVADGLLNRSSDITRLLDRLERAGLAERLRNPADRRGVLVRATARGRKRLDEVTPELQRFHAMQWKNLDAAELDQFNTLLVKALWNGTGGA